MRNFLILLLSAIAPTTSCFAESLQYGRNQLAHIVETQCLPNFQRTNSPAPCTYVDLPQDYVINQDRRGSGHFLLIAISPIIGTESTALLTNETRGYFQNAWRHRGLVAAARGEPMNGLDVAILTNPITTRTQDRLHLHIAPLHRPFAQMLALQAANLTEAWTQLTWDGKPIHVMKINENALTDTNIFALIAQRTSAASHNMSQAAIVLTGAGKNVRGENQLLLIDTTYTDAPHEGWMPEDLLDWRSAPTRIGLEQTAGA